MEILRRRTSEGGRDVRGQRAYSAGRDVMPTECDAYLGDRSLFALEAQAMGPEEIENLFDMFLMSDSRLAEDEDVIENDRELIEVRTKDGIHGALERGRCVG